MNYPGASRPKWRDPDWAQLPIHALACMMDDVFLPLCHLCYWEPSPQPRYCHPAQTSASACFHWTKPVNQLFNWDGISSFSAKEKLFSHVSSKAKKDVSLYPKLFEAKKSILQTILSHAKSGSLKCIQYRLDVFCFHAHFCYTCWLVLFLLCLGAMISSW